MLQLLLSDVQAPRYHIAAIDPLWGLRLLRWLRVLRGLQGL